MVGTEVRSENVDAASEMPSRNPSTSSEEGEQWLLLFDNEPTPGCVDGDAVEKAASPSDMPKRSGMIEAALWKWPIRGIDVREITPPRITVKEEDDYVPYLVG